MQLVIEPGKYVVAVSGGVDSMVLLDLLVEQVKSKEQPGLELVVAHFDHGIREDSGDDKVLVQMAAERYDLVFESADGELGSGASEDAARVARYEFLYSMRKKHSASAIITAHHQDDVLETILINILRGTGRKGLTSLSSRSELIRPLLAYKKSDILGYASKHSLKWHEDSTNQNEEYLRNYVRLKVLPKMTEQQRLQLVTNVDDMRQTNEQIDEEIAQYIEDEKQNTIQKKRVNTLDHATACEVIAGWLRINGIRDFDRKAINRLVVASKTFKPGQRTDINKQKYLVIDKDTLTIDAV